MSFPVIILWVHECNPFSFHSQAVWMPIPQDSTLKVGALECIEFAPHREAKMWGFPPNCMAQCLGKVLR